MRKITATTGSAVFLLIAPGVVAGLVPWWLTGWRTGAAYPPPVRITGAVLTAAGGRRSSPRSRSSRSRAGALAGLATDDEHQARLRETLLVFLQSGGSYKATAERLVLHKNTVHYRIRRAEESLGRGVGENRHDVELALQVSFWLGAAVLHPGPASATAGASREKADP